MVLVHDTSPRRGLQVYQVSLKNLKRFSSYRADTICDGQTDRQTDRRRGKNNMSPDPVGGRHNDSKIIDIKSTCILVSFSSSTFNNLIITTCIVIFVWFLPLQIKFY